MAAVPRHTGLDGSTELYRVGAHELWVTKMQNPVLIGQAMQARRDGVVNGRGGRWQQPQPNVSRSGAEYPSNMEHDMGKADTASNRISPANMRRLEAHLRQLLGCPTLALDQPFARSASVQFRIGPEVLGTVDQVDEDGERSWAVTLVVLEEDLAG